MQGLQVEATFLCVNTPSAGDSNFGHCLLHERTGCKDRLYRLLDFLLIPVLQSKRPMLMEFVDAKSPIQSQFACSRWMIDAHVEYSILVILWDDFACSHHGWHGRAMFVGTHLRQR